MLCGVIDLLFLLCLLCLVDVLLCNEIGKLLCVVLFVLFVVCD